MTPQPRIECDCGCDQPYDTWKRRQVRTVGIVSAVLSLVALAGLMAVLSGCALSIGTKVEPAQVRTIHWKNMYVIGALPVANGNRCDVVLSDGTYFSATVHGLKEGEDPCKGLR